MSGLAFHPLHRSWFPVVIFERLPHRRMYTQAVFASSLELRQAGQRKMLPVYLTPTRPITQCLYFGQA